MNTKWISSIGNDCYYIPTHSISILNKSTNTPCTECLGLPILSSSTFALKIYCIANLFIYWVNKASTNAMGSLDRDRNNYKIVYLLLSLHCSIIVYYCYFLIFKLYVFK